jgi:hypothetical protein
MQIAVGNDTTLLFAPKEAPHLPAKVICSNYLQRSVNDQTVVRPDIYLAIRYHQIRKMG